MVSSQVRGSVVMLALLNDETRQSAWCVEEWRLARQHGVPVVAVFNQDEHSLRNIRDMIASYRDGSCKGCKNGDGGEEEGFPWLFEHQSVLFTSSNRRAVFDDLSGRLRQFARAATPIVPAFPRLSAVDKGCGTTLAGLPPPLGRALATHRFATRCGLRFDRLLARRRTNLSTAGRTQQQWGRQNQGQQQLPGSAMVLSPSSAKSTGSTAEWPTSPNGGGGDFGGGGGQCDALSASDVTVTDLLDLLMPRSLPLASASPSAHAAAARAAAAAFSGGSADSEGDERGAANEGRYDALLFPFSAAFPAVAAEVAAAAATVEDFELEDEALSASMGGGGSGNRGESGGGSAGGGDENAWAAAAVVAVLRRSLWRALGADVTGWLDRAAFVVLCRVIVVEALTRGVPFAIHLALTADHSDHSAAAAAEVVTAVVTAAPTPQQQRSVAARGATPPRAYGSRGGAQAAVAAAAAVGASVPASGLKPVVKPHAAALAALPSFAPPVCPAVLVQRLRLYAAARDRLLSCLPSDLQLSALGRGHWACDAHPGGGGGGGGACTPTGGFLDAWTLDDDGDAVRLFREVAAAVPDGRSHSHSPNDGGGGGGGGGGLVGAASGGGAVPSRAVAVAGPGGSIPVAESVAALLNHASIREGFGWAPVKPQKQAGGGLPRTVPASALTDAAAFASAFFALSNASGATAAGRGLQATQAADRAAHQILSPQQAPSAVAVSSSSSSSSRLSSRSSSRSSLQEAASRAARERMRSRSPVPSRSVLGSNPGPPPSSVTSSGHCNGSGRYNPHQHPCKSQSRSSLQAGTQLGPRGKASAQSPDRACRSAAGASSRGGVGASAASVVETVSLQEFAAMHRFLLALHALAALTRHWQKQQAADM